MRLFIDYEARPQFLDFHKRRQRWSVLVCHRGAGKTVATIHDLLDSALRSRDPRARFAYVAPTFRQAKRVAWQYLRDAVSKLGPLGVETNETELRVYVPGGWEVGLFGSDNPDSLRGLHLNGVVLDEYADMDPRTWSAVISPALSSKAGWAVFIGTPKGHNGFYDKWRESQADPSWFSMMLKASESGIHSAEELETQRKLLSEEEYAQEYEGSFDAAIVGAYYGRLISAAESDKRITGVPNEPTAPVWTSWDLGIRDATAIWFCQLVGREVHVIDYYESSGAELGHYVRQIGERPYLYGGHIVPHDAQARELGTGKSRLEVLESLGLRNITVCPNHSVEDGINAVRVTLPKCWFDATKTARGIDALKMYRAEYDDKLRALRPRPVHDWASHAADAFRYLAMGLDNIVPHKVEPRSHYRPVGGWQSA